MNRITKLAFRGAIGFGIGGIIAVSVIYIITILFDMSFIFDMSLPYPFLYPGAILGCIGGASLGTLLKSRRSIAVLALAGAIGFEVGFVIGGWVSIVSAFSQMPILLTGFVYGGIAGAVGGASLGLAFNDLRRTGLLAIAGTVGFGIPVLISPHMWLKGLYPGIIDSPSLGASAFVIILLAVGGACLGATLGYQEKRKAN